VDSSVVGYDGPRNVKDEEHPVGLKKPEREQKEPKQSRWGFRGKTVWDWMTLLIVPLALVVIGLVFTMLQDARQQKIEDNRAQQAQKIENQRAKAERELAEQRAQDEALQAYLDQMSGLLLERDLRTSEEDSEVRTLAQARTLTVLERLDPSRKTAVMQFLVEARLVQSVKGRGPILILFEADLSGADLVRADLSDANLFLADLSNANLRYADLYGASVTEEQLAKCHSLEGATMPNGQKYEEWLKDAGQLHTTKFEPAFLIEIGKVWEFGAPETPDQVWIQRGPNGGQLLFTNPSDVFAPSNPSEQKKLPAPESAKEWVSWFQSHPNLDTSKPVPVSVGGASGMQIDVTPSSTPQNDPKKFCGEEPCVPLYPLSDGSGIISSEGYKDRFVIVDVGGQTVLVDVAARADKFDAFSPKAQKVLDTAEWKSE
jgi:hypothetical protein